MADRLSQYSMGHNFAPGTQGMMQQHQLNAMQQQQQLQQQSGQQPDSSQQPHLGMPGFSDQRLWSQMQHMQQMRNQNGQDMNTPQQASNCFIILLFRFSLRLFSAVFMFFHDGFLPFVCSAHISAQTK